MTEEGYESDSSSSSSAPPRRRNVRPTRKVGRSGRREQQPRQDQGENSRWNNSSAAHANTQSGGRRGRTRPNLHRAPPLNEPESSNSSSSSNSSGEDEQSQTSNLALSSALEFDWDTWGSALATGIMQFVCRNDRTADANQSGDGSDAQNSSLGSSDEAAFSYNDAAEPETASSTADLQAELDNASSDDNDPQASSSSSSNEDQNAESDQSVENEFVGGEYEEFDTTSRSHPLVATHSYRLPRTGAQELCVVCQDSLQENQSVMTLPCFHVFHEECVKQWIDWHATCPTCKLNLNSSRLRSMMA
ncbi:unnamed protein product [Calicophoron daubneyi]